MFGNSELKAEKIDTWDLAFDYRPNFDWKILFNLYRYQASDLISPVAGKMQNTLKQDGIGSEFEAHWQLNDQLKIKVGYAWQHAESSDNNAIADAPQDTIDFSIQWKIMPDLTLYAASFWLKNRERANTDLRPNIEDYNLTNLTIYYTGFDNITLTLAAKNVFDSDAREASNGAITEDYPLQERGYWLTASYQY
jgi:iron complex outermembrane receptor protein